VDNEHIDRLLVYPKILPLEDIGIPSRHPFGDLRVKRHLFEDPVLVMTTREYVNGDPLKYIHWKSTARLQKLQSRVFEHTTTIDMALFWIHSAAGYQLLEHHQPGFSGDGHPGGGRHSIILSPKATKSAFTPTNNHQSSI
jgi:hypothetical protein